MMSASSASSSSTFLSVSRQALLEDLLGSPYDLAAWLRLIADAEDQLVEAQRRQQERLSSLSSSSSNESSSKSGLKDSAMDPERAQMELLVALEQAVAALPGSYKLWRMLLQQRVRWSKKYHPDDSKHHGVVIGTFERALRLPFMPRAAESVAAESSSGFSSTQVSGLLSRMPRLWLDYIEYLRSQQKHLLSHTRRVFDAALCSLPPAQHYRIWAEYLDWINSPIVSVSSGGEQRELRVPVAVGKHVYQRFLKHDPSRTWEFIEYLKDNGEWADAVSEMLQVLFGNTSAQATSSVTDVWWSCGEANLRGMGNSGMEDDEDNDATLLKPDSFLAAIGSSELIGAREGDTARDIYLQICDIISEHGDNLGSMVGGKVLRVDVDTLIRGGLARFKGDTGRLWTTLAQFYTRRGDFDIARAVFEEGANSVMTAHDFSLIWDAYTQFEDSLLAAQEQLASSGISYASEDANDMDAEAELELSLERYERLLDRQPLLLNAVWLRQNPHNVAHWLYRANFVIDELASFDLTEPSDDDDRSFQLWEATRQAMAAKVIDVFTQALEQVDPRRAVRGKPFHIWRAFAHWYEQQTLAQIEDAEENGEDSPSPEKLWASTRAVYERAVRASHLTSDDVANVWSSFVEFEIRRGHLDQALQVCMRATARPVAKSSDSKEDPLKSAYRSPQLWHLLADLEESKGNLDGAKGAYDHAIELRAASVKTILSLAQLLQTAWPTPRWELSFAVFERGLEMFPRPPRCVPLWLAYLSSFVECHGGSKLERARELFESALSSLIGTTKAFGGSNVHAAEHQDALRAIKAVYLMYANLEEEYGLSRRALTIYSRAASEAASSPWWRGNENSNVTDAFALYLLYIQRTAELFGVTRTRSVFDEAIQAVSPLSPRYTVRLCLRFAAAETFLGEIDRARAIYVQAAQLADPSAPAERAVSDPKTPAIVVQRALTKFGPSLWREWREFEMEHGSEETYRDMIRIRRTVSAKFSGGSSSNSVVTLGHAAGSVRTMESAVEDMQFDEGMTDMERLEALAAHAAAEERTHSSSTPSSGVMGVSFTRAAGSAVHSANDYSLYEETKNESADEGIHSSSGMADIQEKQVPLSVFERNVPSDSAGREGAMDRLKKARNKR